MYIPEINLCNISWEELKMSYLVFISSFLSLLVAKEAFQ